MKRQRPAKHGTSSKYTAGCRCDSCREAWRLYAQEQRRKKGKQPKRRKCTCDSLDCYTCVCFHHMRLYRERLAQRDNVG